MYDLAQHGLMIADQTRTGAYAKALERAVRPGAVVVDLGAGSGIMSLLACRLGAARVYAIEPDEVIEVARQLARDNGYEDRIEFIQDVSTNVSLPQRADVIVADLRGILPLFQSHLPSLADARERFLASGGTMIPSRDTLWAAVVEAPHAFGEVVGPWRNECHGLSLKAGMRFATNSWRRWPMDPECSLAGPQCWADLDYTRPLSTNHRGAVEFRVARPGTGHGLLVWFDTVLVEGVGYSNAPGQPPMVYGAMFFPWPTEVALAEGDTVSVGLRADLVGANYEWSWESSVSGGSSAQSKADFRQSTFLGRPLSPATLRLRAESFRPPLNEDGEIDRFALGRMDGMCTLGEIAQELSERFPARFASRQEALTRVGELSEKYGR